VESNALFAEVRNLTEGYADAGNLVIRVGCNRCECKNEFFSFPFFVILSSMKLLTGHPPRLSSQGAACCPLRESESIHDLGLR
jgi:hypothetical protein